MDDYSSRLVGKTHSSCRSAETPLKDPLPMVLHVPSAPHRPGDVPCFAPVQHEPGGPIHLRRTMNCTATRRA